MLLLFGNEFEYERPELVLPDGSLEWMVLKFGSEFGGESPELVLSLSISLEP